MSAEQKLKVSGVENLASFSEEGIANLFHAVIEDVNANGIQPDAEDKGVGGCKGQVGCGTCVNGTWYPCA